MKVGVQLFSVKEHLMRDCLGTLREVSRMGYKYIEPFCSPSYPLGEGEKGYGLGLSRRDAKAFLADNNLELVGTHYGSPGREDLESVCDYFAFLGAKNIGTGGRFFPGGKDDLMRLIDEMNRGAEIAGSFGMRYYYHTHYWEFQRFDGKTAFELMLENTDPDKVFFEIDNYWAARGGENPTALADRLGSRQIMMHQNDFAGDTGEPLNLFQNLVLSDRPITHEIHVKYSHAETFAEVGTGILPIQSYIDAGVRNGVECIIIEMDFTTMDELDSIRISRETFERFSGISWD